MAYRYWAQRLANTLGVSGYAENMPDGSVSIKAEGEEKDLEEFVKLCHNGSPFAKVTSVEVREGKVKNYLEFDVK